MVLLSSACQARLRSCIAPLTSWPMDAARGGNLPFSLLQAFPIQSKAAQTNCSCCNTAVLQPSCAESRRMAGCNCSYPCLPPNCSAI